jgi:hypothetical protein
VAAGAADRRIAGKSPVEKQPLAEFGLGRVYLGIAGAKSTAPSRNVAETAGLTLPLNRDTFIGLPLRYDASLRAGAA